MQKILRSFYRRPLNIQDQYLLFLSNSSWKHIGFNIVVSLKVGPYPSKNLSKMNTSTEQIFYLYANFLKSIIKSFLKADLFKYIMTQYRLSIIIFSFTQGKNKPLNIYFTSFFIKWQKFMTQRITIISVEHIVSQKTSILVCY